MKTKGRVRKAPPAGGAERELKFEVPAKAFAPLLQEMVAAGAEPVPLHAVYHDTEDGALAQARVSLRMRREDDRWVQTLKAPGRTPLERLEDEVLRGKVRADGPPPAIELQRHAAPDAVQALRRALGLKKEDPWPAVQPTFEVKVQRHVLRVPSGRSLVEVALDDGELLAGGHRRPIRELELELVEGDLQDLVALARTWRTRAGLWLATASKAARGNLLLRGALHGPAATAKAPEFTDRPGTGAFNAAVLHACMEQVTRNAGDIATGCPSDDHVHQLRVGIRRLRTALRELPGLANDRERFEPVLVGVFRGLGERRDRTHVLRTIEPMIEAAGGKPLRIPPGFHEGTDPVDLVRADAFQDTLLALLARAEQLRSGSGKPVRKVVRKRLDALHAQVTHDGRRFTRLPEDRQHQVRKRLKRLRYLSEFAAPLFAARGVRRYVARMKPAQDALGQYNDEVMAQALFEELAAIDPDARFGVEWLQARRKGEAKACRQSLRALEDGRPFWQER